MPLPRSQTIRGFDYFLNRSLSSKGVEIAAIVEDQSPLKKIYNPNHPDADRDGYMHMPNVEVVNEMINLIFTPAGRTSPI